MAVEFARYRRMRRGCIVSCCRDCARGHSTSTCVGAAAGCKYPLKQTSQCPPSRRGRCRRRAGSLLSQVLCGKQIVFRLEWPLVARTSALPLLLRYGGTNEQPTAALPEHVSCCRCQAQCLQGRHIWSVVVLSTPSAQVTRPKDHGGSWTRGTAHRATKDMGLGIDGRRLAD